MQNGSIFINEKITRTEKFSLLILQNSVTKYYVALNGLPNARRISMLAFLLIGLQPIWILSTNMFVFIPLNRHNLPDIFFSTISLILCCCMIQYTGLPSIHSLLLDLLRMCMCIILYTSKQFEIYNVNKCCTNREKESVEKKPIYALIVFSYLAFRWECEYRLDCKIPNVTIAKCHAINISLM